MLPRSWEQKILKLSVKPCNNHQVTEELLQEVRELYFQEMTALNLKNPPPRTPRINNIPTKNIELSNSSFEKKRTKFSNSYFLSHKLIRTIIKLSAVHLPPILFDIKNHRNRNALTLNEISFKIKQDIRRTGLHVSKHFYFKIVKFISHNKTLKTMEESRLKSLFRCATAVFSQLILNSMNRTIDHLIDSLRAAENYPRMKLDLIFNEEQIELKPSLDDIFSKFNSIIDDVAGILQDLLPLEYWMNIKIDGYIKMKLPGWFVANSHARLQSVLRVIFQSLQEHCESTNARFRDMDVTSITGPAGELRQEEFNEFCARVETLNEFFRRARSLVDEVYFDVSTLSQTRASEHLQKYIGGKTDALLTKLVSQHRNFATSIHVDFESLKRRALNVPNETKPLFQLCEYLSHASKVVVKELEERIRRSMSMLKSLSQIATLSEEHVQLNAAIVHELWGVDHVFQRSNNMCESMKSVLEDELQRKINALNAKIDEIVPELVMLNDMDDVVRVREYKEFLVILIKKVGLVEDEIQQANAEEKLFKFPETAFPKIIEIKDILLPFSSLVRLICDWRRDHDVWMHGLFEKLNADEIERKTARYYEELTRISGNFKIKIKTEMALSRAFKFTGIVDDPDPMQHPAPLKLCWQALRDIHIFQRYVPLATCMCNKSLAKRHWDEMSAIAGLDLTPNARTTLGTLVDLNLFDDLSKYEVISINANKEVALKNLLEKIMEDWKDVSFEINQSGVSKSISFTFHDEIGVILENHTAEVEVMKCSNFVGPIANEVETYCASLDRLRYCMNQLPVLFDDFNDVECLFSKNIVSKEGHELYDKIVILLEEIRVSIAAEPNFYKLFSTSEVIDKIDEGTTCMKGLKKLVALYIDDLKYKFRRLFFLSNEDILTILKLENDTCFKKCFRKCFPDLKVQFDKNANIVSAIGKQGEKIKLNRIISTHSNNDSEITWLNLFEEEMLNSIKRDLLESHSYLKNVDIYQSFDSIKKWIEKTVGIIVICAFKIIWTSQIIKCITDSESSSTEMKFHYENQMKLKTSLINDINNSISNRRRLILMTLIINLIHEENFLQHFMRESISHRNFLWKMKFKYHLNNGEVQISTINTFINYGYEYYSITKPQTIITPLTERCYHSLIITYTNNLSAAIIGSNSTGKLETVTSLARIIATLFYVFDCNNKFDYNFIKQIFTGFILRGPWLCFKNFCCIDEEFFSLIGEYVCNINSTKNAGKEIIKMNDSSLKLNTSGFFCTIMNPSCERKMQILDETKRNFRTLTIMQPDIQTIVEIYLSAAGFSESKTLASILKTMISSFNQQRRNNTFNHEFNLNTIIKITEIAYHTKVHHPCECENAILLRALIEVCLPKLTENEIIMFLHLVRDAKLNSTFPPPNYFHLLELVENVSCSKSFYLNENLKLKILQFFETIHFQRTILILGEALSGKTSLINILGEALSIESKSKKVFDHEIRIHSLNQNSVTCDRFYEFLAHPKWTNSTDARIWNWLVFDGNLSNTCHQLVQELSENKSYFLTPYTETLSSSNRMSVIFETSDLQDVSPSFVAKCNVIYLNNLNVMTIINHEMKQRYPNYQDFMSTLFEWSTTSCAKFLNKFCSNIVNIQNGHSILSTWKLFKHFMDHAFETNQQEKDIKKDNVVTWSQAAVVLSTIWGLGGCLDESSQIIFDSFCVSLWTGSNEDFPFPKDMKPFENFSLNARQLREYFFVFKNAGNWKYSGDALKGETIIEHPLGFRNPFVPTIDTIRLGTILQYNLQNRQPFILCSESPSGKTAYLKYFFENKLEDLNCSANYFHMTSNMSVKNAEEYILSKTMKTDFARYKSNEKPCINFIDDLHLAMEANTVTPILELIRQHFDHGYWYDTNKLREIYLRETMFCGALTRPNKNICQRFLRHFNVYAIHPPAKDNMFRIFSNILLSNLKKNLFASDVQPNVHNIVNATLAVYESIATTLKAVPSKCQYLFNLRDVARIISSCSLIEKDSVESKVTFLRLWVHETFRVFGDKINDDADRNWLFTKMKDVVKTVFKDSLESAFDHLPKGNNNGIVVDNLKGLFFGNFATNGKDTDNNYKYEEISSLSVLKSKVLQHISNFNEKCNRVLEVTLTNHFLEHLIKLCRILSLPKGNLLMISSHGSGRKTLALLASFIERQTFVELSVASVHNIKRWKNDLKDILLACGLAGKDTTFLCKDRRLNKQYFQDLSSLVKYGEIPQLFSKQEWLGIIRKVRLLAQSGDRNMELPANDIKEYFTQQCRNKLHIIVCINLFEGKRVRHVVQNYSNLTTCCHIGYFENWPQEALQQVASSYLQNISISEDVKNVTLKTCMCFHESIQNEDTMKILRFTGNYVPVPTTYIRMVKLFADNFNDIQQAKANSHRNYIHGLEKLEKAIKHTEEIKEKLYEFSRQCVNSSQESEAIMEEIKQEKVLIESTRVSVMDDEATVRSKTERATMLKREYEADLVMATPILEDISVAINSLKSTDISQIKSMKNPSEAVKLTMAAVCVMLAVPPDRVTNPKTGKKTTDYWGPSKRILGDPNFLQDLKDYDKNDISPSVMQTIQNSYMTDASFNPRLAAKTSCAAEGLCKWVRSMASYDKIAKIMAPKKELLVSASQECRAAESQLEEKRKLLEQLNDKADTLNNILKAALDKKSQFEFEVTRCSAKLEKAERLVTSLINEKERWLRNANLLQQRLDNVIGDAILITGVINYLGPFNFNQRNHILAEWRQVIRNMKLPCSSDYGIVDGFGQQFETDLWTSNGLPRDAFSLESAIIVERSLHWAYLFVDSDKIANSWIKNTETERSGFKIVDFEDETFLDDLKYCMETGVAVLIENAEPDHVDDLMFLASQSNSENEYINFGDTVILRDRNFRLFIFSDLRQPPEKIETYNAFIVVNFTINDETLQNQLLDILIMREQPEFSNKFKDVEIQCTKDKKIMKNEESRILSVLSESKDVIEDESAIEMIAESKKLLDVVKENENVYEAMKNEFDERCNSYGPFIMFATKIYNIINMLNDLNYIYNHSTAWFISTYKKSVETSNRSSNLEKLLNYFKLSLLKQVYTSVHRALFEKDKLLYSFLLAVIVQSDAGLITNDLVNTFTHINKEVQTAAEKINPCYPWLSEKCWQQICFVSSNISGFQQLTTSFEKDSSWKSYVEADESDERELPLPWNKLSLFEQLIIVKIICPKRFILILRKFIDNSIGSVPELDLRTTVAKCYLESNCITPIMFILPCYSSPLMAVSSHAKLVGIWSKITNIYLGQKQVENVAESVIENSRLEGYWVFIHNCHLSSKTWLKKLDKILEDFDLSSTCSDFRLYLSTSVTEKLPSNLIRRSLKVVHDDPKNLKQFLVRSYDSELCTKSPSLSQLLHSLFFFHAVVSGRRTFGIRSWNIDYQFEEPDLQFSLLLLKNVMSASHELHEELLKYLIGNCIYGGQMLDSLDNETLHSILKICLNPETQSHKITNLYVIPEIKQRKDWISFINQNLTEHDSPELYGFDDTAGFAKNLLNIKHFSSCLSKLPNYSLKNNTSVEDKENFVKTVIKCTRNALTIIIDINHVAEKYPLDYLEPLNGTLCAESRRYNKMIATIVSSLRELDDFYNGLAAYKLSCEELERQMFYGEVPLRWCANGPMRYTERSLAAFIDELCNRLRFITNWIDNGHPRTFLLKALTMPGALLVAIKLKFSRNNAIDASEALIDYVVVGDCQDRTEDQVLFSDLFLSGAMWNRDSGMLMTNTLKIPYCTIPEIQLQLKIQSDESVKNQKRYDCPLYVSSMARNKQLTDLKQFSNYVSTVGLGSDVDPDHWRVNGTCLYCDVE